MKVRGFFDHPPKVKLLPDGYVQYPFWPEFQFLKNVANEAAEKVVEIILEIPKTDNPRFYDDVIDIALNIEAPLSTRIKGRILEYVQGGYRFLGSPFEKVLEYWVSNGESDKQKRRRANPKDWTTQLEPRPRFDEWKYEQILEKGVRSLIEKVPYQVAIILIDATANMIRLKFHHDYLEENSGSDLSTIWCQRVNDSSRDHQNSNKSLVHTLTSACEKVYESL